MLTKEENKASGKQPPLYSAKVAERLYPQLSSGNSETEDSQSSTSTSSTESSDNTTPLLNNKNAAIQKEDIEPSRTESRYHVPVSDKSNPSSNAWQKDIQREDIERCPKRKSECSQHDRLSWVLAVISIIICLISIILMGFTVLEYCNRSQPEFQSFTEVLEDRAVCLPCMKLILDPFNPNGPDPLMDKLTKKWDENELLCCAETSEQRSVMKEAFTRPQKPRPDLPSTRLPALKRVSAHKALLEPDRSLDPKKDHMLTRMDPHFHDPVREHVRGVKVNEIAMIIQHTGYYYVYISALYKANSSHIGMEPPGRFWLVSVHRVSPHDSVRGEFLLTIAHSPSPTDMESQAKHTGYSGGVFLLEKGESLTVCVEAHDTVEFKKKSTYLGLYWVRDPSNNMSPLDTKN